jgi:hypothetical protein
MRFTLLYTVIMAATAVIVVGVVLWLPGGEARDGTLRVMFTGETLGQLEPCNCTGGMAGGLPARGGYVEQQTGPFLLLDVGCVGAGARQFEQLRSEAALRAMKVMGYDAVNIGEHETWLTPQELRRLDDVGVPFVSANVTDEAGRPVTRSHVLVERGGLTIAVTGLVDDGYTPRGDGLHVDPPDEALARWLASAPQVDAVIVLADLDEQQVRDLARRFPEVTAAYIRGRGESLPPTRVNRTVIASVYGETLYIADTTLHLDDGFGEGTATMLDRQYTTDPRIEQASIDWYKRQLQGRDFDLTEQRPGWDRIYATVTAPGNGYVGSGACTNCHQYEHNKFVTDAHARAMESLRNVGYERSPECVVCHVVGYGVDTGYVSMDATPQLAQVGCEACHGPGEPLLTGACIGNARRGGIENCVRCHTGKHDPTFNYAHDWPLIDHTEPK